MLTWVKSQSFDQLRYREVTTGTVLSTAENNEESSLKVIVSKAWLGVFSAIERMMNLYTLDIIGTNFV